MEANDKAKREISQPDQDWKDICAKCNDGDIEPKFCAYYGEPNGCNSPTYGEHPTTEKSSAVGNAAKLREAVEAISKAFDDALICTDYQMSAEEHDRLDAIYRQVKEALAAPARNCDVGTARQQERRHKEEVCLKSACPKHEGFVCKACKGCFAMWAQMPYESEARK